MQVGVVLPQNEISTDPSVIRDYVRTAEELGYRHLSAGEHVVGHDPKRHPDIPSPFSVNSLWHEPLTLFAWMAAITSELRFITGVLVLSQRQTALVAKQAAEVALLSGGRLTLGIGIGSNPVEYAALGADFSSRGRRVDEQIGVLRALWSQRVVELSGRFHQLEGVGINPLPARAGIPIWIGGSAKVALDRAGRVGDGWIAGHFRNRNELSEQLARVRSAAEQAGRDPASLAVHVAVGLGPDSVERQLDRLPQWEEMGITHLSVRTMEMGLSSPQDHIDLLRVFAEGAKLR